MAEKAHFFEQTGDIFMTEEVPNAVSVLAHLSCVPEQSYSQGLVLAKRLMVNKVGRGWIKSFFKEPKHRGLGDGHIGGNL